MIKRTKGNKRSQRKVKDFNPNICEFSNSRVKASRSIEEAIADVVNFYRVPDEEISGKELIKDWFNGKDIFRKRQSESFC